jgi:hypothetical protein
VSAGAAVLKPTSLILSQQISPNVCWRPDSSAMQTPPESRGCLCSSAARGL